MSLCQPSQYEVLLFYVLSSPGGGWFQRLHLALLTTISYLIGQGADVRILQTTKQAHSNCTCGPWGNNHQVDPQVHGTPCELHLVQEPSITWTSRAPLLGDPSGHFGSGYQCRLRLCEKPDIFFISWKHLSILFSEWLP